MEAAQRVLGEDGYHRTTIEHIAKRAGVGKQTIYRWWGSKPALFMEVYRELASQHVQPPDTGDLRADLEKLWRQLCRFYRRTAAGPALAGLLADAQADAAVAESFRDDFLKERREVTMQILRRGADRGHLRQGVDLEVVVDSIAGAVWYRLLTGTAPMTPRFVSSLVGQVLDGVGEPPTAPAP